MAQSLEDVRCHIQVLAILESPYHFQRMGGRAVPMRASRARSTLAVTKGDQDVTGDLGTGRLRFHFEQDFIAPPQ